MKTFGQKLTIGLIKGGQLGRMLIQEMLNFNLEAAVLDNDPDAPCRECAREFVPGDCDDAATVYQFGKKVDILALEFEHVNIAALEKLEQEGVPVFPSSKVLRIIQDKGLQKQFYRDHGIPTADFVLAENRADIQEKADFFPLVQKTRKAGYDGKGVYKIETPAHLEHAFDEPSVLEKKVDFVKEISVVLARGRDGGIAMYPVVELEFHPEKNLVEFLFAPANISKKTEQEALAIAQKIAEKLQYVGLLAVEMFVLKDGSVLVNEMAPRVHNSGHHTIEANMTSQFEQHLRAILGLPPGSTTMISPAVMINLLGEPGFAGEAKYEGMEKVMVMEGVFVHLYGKRTTKPFRKMGHVTVVAESLEKAKEKARLVKSILKVVA